VPDLAIPVHRDATGADRSGQERDRVTGAGRVGITATGQGRSHGRVGYDRPSLNETSTEAARLETDVLKEEKMPSFERNRLQEKVEHGLDICNSVLALADVVGSDEEWVTKAAKGVAEFVPKLDRLKQRLSSNSGTIAVIGSEKAGKSTFINAWLGAILLPTHHERCTLATTEIENVGRAERTTLEIDWRTKEDFRSFVEQLEGAGKSAENDLKEISKHRSRLDAVLGQPKEAKELSDINSLRQEIHKVVANPASAYAVSRARIRMHIPKLSIGTILCDAPGIDSGLQLHQDALSKLLANCDAVILVKVITEPTPQDSEQKLIQRVRMGATEQGLTFTDRLFVFLNRLDLHNRDEAQRLLLLGRNQWIAQGVPSDQIYAGSARAQLLESVSDEDKAILKTEIPITAGEMSECIVKNSILQGALRLKDFSTFQRAAIDFIDSERFSKADRDVSSITNQIRRIGRDALSHFEDYHQVSSGTVVSAQQIWDRKFNRWINRYIDRFISAQINNVFGEGSQQIASLANQPSEYVDGVRLAFTSLPSRNEFDNIFEKFRSTLEEPEKADASARESLHSEIELAMLNRGATIADRLSDLILRLAAVVIELSWGDTGLMEHLIRGEEKLYRAELKSAVNALLMRYARPVNEAYVYASRNTHPRKQSLEKWRRELKTIEIFMSEMGAVTKVTDQRGPEKLADASLPADRRQQEPPANSKRPQATGTATTSAQLKSSAIMDRVTSIVGGSGAQQRFSPDSERIQPESTNQAPKAEASESAHVVRTNSGPNDVFKKVEAEMVEDLSEVQLMLETGVYFASGVQQFCDQEFRRVRQAITSTDNKHFWQAAAMQAFRAKHPTLMATLASELGSSGDGTAERDLALYNQLKQALQPRATTESPL
jgi:GTPase SAR1 family protein